MSAILRKCLPQIMMNANTVVAYGKGLAAQIVNNFSDKNAKSDTVNFIA